MKKFILLCIFSITGCSGSMEHLNKNMQDNEAIVFGRIKVIDIDGRDLTEICNLSLIHDSNKNDRLRVAGINLGNKGLLVGKAPAGQVQFGRIDCGMGFDSGRKFRISIQGSHFEIIKPKSSYYFGDVTITIKTNNNDDLSLDISMKDNAGETVRLYQQKMNNNILLPINRVQWKNGDIR